MSSKFTLLNMQKDLENSMKELEKKVVLLKTESEENFHEHKELCDEILKLKERIKTWERLKEAEKSE